MKDYILDLDKPRKLRFGFKAVRLIRQKFGDRSLVDIMNIKVDEVPVLAWAGLKWEQSTLTIDQVEDLLDAVIPEKYTIMAVIAIIMAAMAAQVGLEIKKADADELETSTTTKEKEKEKAEKTEPTKTIPSSKTPKKKR